MCHITLNKNAVVGDISAMNPGGVRIGTPAMTSRGLKEGDFMQIADFLHEVVQVGEPERSMCVCVHSMPCPAGLARLNC